MRTHASRILAFSTAMLVVGCQQSGSTSTSENVDQTGGVARGDFLATDFYGLLRRVHANYVPVKSVAELKSRAQLVVLGEIESVEDGRVIGGKPGEVKAMHTAVLKVRVSDSMKGDPEEFVYVEAFRSIPTSINALRAAREEQRLLLFLEKAPAIKERVEVTQAGAGHPEDTILYRLLSPQALIAESSEGTGRQPMTDGTPEWIVPTEKSFGELLEEARD